ncbi:GNAT family N-acetyltransferase [Guptibacillus hwajinpoensis]|uniref:GNAT family acetyltransferase n=1 Tax=Guptibacillus hwajinpoensis TaxID=208199 RepID=A0A0J6CTH5_9BACL|nr:GNAT family N-acetyltransferase [Alkalihalobacillus macyae]KMM36498.1 GNAT family acetyltransferase [Alkalihalobacillus macyae]
MKEFNLQKETARLIIRPLRVEDYHNWLHEFNARYEAQHEFDPGKLDMSECTEEWFIALVQKHQELAMRDEAHVFGIFHKEDGTHIGMVDFSTLARMSFQWARIGYTIHNQYWRNGFGKEAVSAALEVAFRDLKFHRIEAHINLENRPSTKLAESVGMDFECVRKGFIFEGESWTDQLVYVSNSEI